MSLEAIFALAEKEKDIIITNGGCDYKIVYTPQDEDFTIQEGETTYR